MERVVDPLIADLQREYREAVRRGRTWKSRWVQIAGWVSFVKVMVICAGMGLMSGAPWTADDRRALRRALVISIALVVAITILLVLPSAQNYPSVLLRPNPRRFLYLAPYPFVAGVVIGVTLGIVLGLGGRALSRRLAASVIAFALVCCAVAFVDVGWVAPAASVAYRTNVFGDADPVPGMGEQSIGALRRQIEQFSGDPAFAHFGFPLALSFDYHRRVALSFAPLVFALLALALTGRFRRRWVPAVAAVVALLAYAWLVVRLRPWDIQLPAYAAAWLPNATIATLAAAFGILSALRRAAHRRLAC